MNLDRLVKEINKHFGEPFLAKDFVEAHINDRGDFILRIGTRDMQLYSDGKFMGAGTDLTRIYEITEHEAEPIIVEEE